MADFTIDGVPLGSMPVCGGCGALVASERASCPLCATSSALRRLVPDRTDGRAFVRVVAHFLCRSCGQRSPLNALDVDGTVTCARCHFTQAFDVSVWSEALYLAHGAADLGFPKPEGRHARAGEPSVAEHPAAQLGKSQNALAFESSSVVMDGGVMRTRSLSLELAPGHPLCETCHAPLLAALEEGALRIGCEPCGTVMRYALPVPERRIEHLPVGIYADDCCIDRPDASMIESQGGAVAIKCPTCNAALEASIEQHFVTCHYCRTACRIPSRTLWAMHADRIEAKPFWLLFEGRSAARGDHIEQLERRAQAARTAAERDAYARAEAERRAEFMLALSTPELVPATAATKLRLSLVGVLMTLAVGALLWGTRFMAVASGGDPVSAASSSDGQSVLGSAPEPVAPDVRYVAIAGCSCPGYELGLDREVRLAARLSTTLELGQTVTSSVGWALVSREGEVVSRLATSAATAPSEIVTARALDLALACRADGVHVVDGARATRFDPRSGAALRTYTVERTMPQTSRPEGRGLVVRCTQGSFAGDTITWREPGVSVGTELVAP